MRPTRVIGGFLAVVLSLPCVGCGCWEADYYTLTWGDDPILHHIIGELRHGETVPSSPEFRAPIRIGVHFPLGVEPPPNTIELYDVTGAAVDVPSTYLSDVRNDQYPCPRSERIYDVAVLEPGEYTVVHRESTVPEGLTSRAVGGMFDGERALIARLVVGSP